MSAQHTPITAGIAIDLRIGQQVRHRDHLGERVTGVVQRICVDSDTGLMVEIGLDAPIIIPASEGSREIRIYRQYVPAHELAPFDDRDALIAELTEALQQCTTDEGPETDQLHRARALIARATGSAS